MPQEIMYGISLNGFNSFLSYQIFGQYSNVPPCQKLLQPIKSCNYDQTIIVHGIFINETIVVSLSCS